MHSFCGMPEESHSSKKAYSFAPQELKIDWSHANNAWEKLPDILNQINPPTFPDSIFQVSDYAEVSLVNTAKNTKALQQAIDDCHAAGGGQVVLPTGVYTCGAIHLKDNVNLHVGQGSTLSFSTNPSDYMPLVKTHFEGMELMNFSAPIFASESENIAITGKGTIDGNASFDNWWLWSKKNWHKLPKNRPRLMEYNKNQTPVEERLFGLGYNLRPNFIQFYNCKNILIHGVTIKNSPMWNIHTILSENITVDSITVLAPYESPNTDALDFESSKNILVQHSTFDVGDDCITIKSGRNQDGRRINTPTKNLIARNCYVKNGRGGIVIGSEITGGANNIFMENCKMDSPNLNRAVRIKSSEVRGGEISNIFVRDLEIGSVGGPILNIDLHYTVRDAERDGNTHLASVKNVFLENITCEQADHSWYLDGYNESKIENVFMKNISIVEMKNPQVLKHVENFQLENVRVGQSKEDLRLKQNESTKKN